MKQITVGDIVAAGKGTLLCGDASQQIEHICIDSRVSQGNDIFVPIIGEKVDAHRFIAQALGNGCVATLTSEHTEASGEKAWIQVEDTIEALHDIGRLCRSRVTIPAVGVTGSVGKTTTREMIAMALSAQKRIYKTGKNYNSSVGLPITLSEMSNDYDMAVLELGMNVPGELGTISRIAQISMAVVTNIGVAHMEFYGSREKLCEEKLTITTGLQEGGIVFLNGDDELLMRYRDTVPFPVLTYGTGVQCDYRAEDIHMEEGHYCFTLIHGATRQPVKLSVLGIHNIGNACAALAVADQCGVDLDAAAAALYAFTGFANRLERFEKDGLLVIDDTYNASPDSMKAGLDVLAGMENTGRKIAVLGDMFELGSESPVYHYQVGTHAATLQIDEMVLVGTLAKEIGRAMKEAGSVCPIQYFAERADAANYLKTIAKAGDVIYIKASNGMKLKEITAELMK